MIRTTCAWVLLLLAASPVTAPFSTCDLRVFVEQGAYIQSFLSAGVSLSSLSLPEIDTGDAHSLSPLVSRSVLRDHAAAAVAVRPADAFSPRVGFEAYRAPDPHRSPHEWFSPPLVLRL